MFNGKKVVVVMPAYNAEKTLEKTFREVAAQPFVDQVVIVDDASSDDTWTAVSRIEGTTPVTAATRNSATGSRSNVARTSSSWCIRTTSIPRS